MVCTVSYMGGGIIFAFFSRFFFTDLLIDCREARKNFVPLGFGLNQGLNLSLKAENGQKWGPKCKNLKKKLGSLIPTQCTTNGRNFKYNWKKKSLLEPSEVGWGMAIFLIFANFFGQILWISIMGPENAQIFFSQWSGLGGSKMAIFQPKMVFSPYFSYFLS